MMSAADLLTQALLLPEQDRAGLASRLLASLPDPKEQVETEAMSANVLDESEIAEAWEREIDRRLADVDAGQAIIHDWSDARKRIDKALKERRGR